MGRAKPMLGYRTQSEACAALAQEGLTSAEVGARLKIATTTASSSILYKLGPEGINRRPKAPPKIRRTRGRIGKQRTVLVDHDVLDAFAPHAARRDIGVNEFVRRLLGILVDEEVLIGNLFDEAAVRPAAAAE